MPRAERETAFAHACAATILFCAAAVMLASCGMPMGPKIPCRSKATGQTVQAQRGNLTGWLMYRDANGLDQVITPSSSDQWVCRQ